MPLYDYSCEKCGPFTEFRSMSQSSDPMPCPTCREAAQRILTAPFIADMDPNNRIAHQRNEKSAHEPRVVSGKPPGHRHGGGGRRAGRPWSIGH